MLRCPYCSSLNTIIKGKYKHPSTNPDTDVRYRKCLKCSRRFRTIEEVASKERKNGS